MGERCGVNGEEWMGEGGVDIEWEKGAECTWCRVEERGRLRYRVGERCGVNDVGWMGEVDGEFELEICADWEGESGRRRWRVWLGVIMRMRWRYGF